MVLFVYVMTNAAVFDYYLRDRRPDFNIILHALFPLISTAALIYALMYSFIPFPASTYKYAPLIEGLWLVLGIVVLVVMQARGSAEWLSTAGASLGDPG